MIVDTDYTIERVRRVDEKLARACYAFTNETVGDAECFSYVLYDSVNVQRNPMFVARKDNIAVGFVLGKINPHARPSWIDALFVSDSMRRHGLGTALISRIEDVVRRGGAHEIWLASRADAIGFYERHGYKRVASDSVLMQKTL